MDVHKDTNKQRDKAHADKKLRKRYLKDGAIPSIFANVPEYLSSTGSSRRTTVKATSAQRRQHEATTMQQLEETFRKEDDVADASITDIAERLQHETATTLLGFTISVLIYLLEISNDVPHIRASILVKSDHSLVLSIDGCLQARSHASMFCLELHGIKYRRSYRPSLKAYALIIEL